MKIRLIAMVIAMTVINIAALAQEALWNQQEIKSPEINADKSVTFRVQATQAKEVKITGDWIPQEGWMPGSVAMQKDDKGLWTYTTEQLAPELYSYALLIDGFRAPDPNNAYTVRDIATISNYFIIHGPQADLYKVNDIPHGTLARRWYDSPGNGTDRRLTIYTPPGYEAGKTNYPVLYLLHGAGGDEEAWVTLGRAAQIMDNLIAAKKCMPMIVVMPNGNVIQDGAPGEGSQELVKPQFMVPKTMDGTYEATFMDIIHFVEKNYRAIPDKKNRAIAGLSMGGFHSLHISRYYPNQFDYVGLFSAAILPNENVTSKVYEDFDGTLKKQMDNGYKLYWIAIGKTDFLYKFNTDYRAKLDQIGMRYTYTETEGGHIWRNWRVYLSEFAPLLFQ